MDGDETMLLAAIRGYAQKRPTLRVLKSQSGRSIPLPRFRLRTLMTAVAMAAIFMWFSRLKEVEVVLGLVIFALPLVHLLLLVDARFPSDPPPPG